MKKFTVVISETSVITRTIEAENAEAAESMIAEQFDNGEILFEDYENFNVSCKEAV